MKIGRLNRSIGEGSKVGCVLALDLKRKDGASFMSDDCYGHLCTNYGSKWQLDGRYFNGVGNYVDCGDTDILKPSKFTLEAWVNPIVFDNYRAIVTGDSFSLERKSASPYGLSLYTYNGTAWKEINAPGDIPTGIRTRTVATFDGSYGRVYINAVLKGGPTAATISYPGPNTNHFLSIGWSYAGTETARYWNGLIAIVRFYSFADYAPRILSRSIGG